MYDPHTRESRGFGFIRMASTEEADRAITAVNGTEVDGRIVTVEKVKEEQPDLVSMILNQVTFYRQSDHVLVHLHLVVIMVLPNVDVSVLSCWMGCVLGEKYRAQSFARLCNNATTMFAHGRQFFYALFCWFSAVRPFWSSF